MQSATAWRRRKESTPRRAASPTRPHPDYIERLSPEPDHLQPTTPPSTQSVSHSYSTKRQHAAGSLQGLGLSQNIFPERSVPPPDHMYLDSNGSAHLGAKVRSPKHSTIHDHAAMSSYSPSATMSSLQYRSSKGRGHTRSGSTIDDLANIAIATSPQFASHPSFSFNSSPTPNNNSRPNTSYVNGYSQESFDRPAKRIKSDRFFGHDQSIQEERPRTSSAHHTEIKPEDAELLLNVRNAFRAPLASSAPLAQAQFSPQPVSTIPVNTHSYQDPSPPDQGALSVEIELEPGKYSRLETAPVIEDSTVPTNAATHEEYSEKLAHRESEQIDNHGMTKQESPGIPSFDCENEHRPAPQPTTSTIQDTIEKSGTPAPVKKQRRIAPTRVAEWCSVCRNTQYAEAQEGSKIDWIECVGCKRWLHYPCAGFQNAQDVKKVDKFFCKDCEPIHGETTYVRTSSRARTAPDYAALNEGLMKTSEEETQHHYIQRIKNNELSLRRDDFARVRPALVTAEWWEDMDGMKRPFVVPSVWNPKFGIYSEDPEEIKDPKALSSQAGKADAEKRRIDGYIKYDGNRNVVEKAKEPWDLTTEKEADEVHEKTVIDLDQDFLGMVMPHDLTVRKVAELYGPNEPLPVIDVKSQATKGKFNLRSWADYYENPKGQPIRNVISLEVSNSSLGRLIRRPKVVQDIDLEDQVWDFDSRYALNKKSVAYYCLMSIADSYTDFHIDFGGSSVYYHILKGMKSFFFIPPEERYLKRYEEWCNSVDQGQTWLGDLCNGNVTRVDLYPGDTAFIPAGWIHSVWTPADSLVIGGNFLTRYDLDLQIKVAQIEKNTGVASLYRYPFFQKVMWFTLIKYLEDDPVPESLIREFLDDPDYRYLRANPIWADRDVLPTDHEPEDGEFNARNYSKSELRGLPALRDYLYRTARIYADLPVEKIDKKKIDAVKKSIPKGHGDPMQLVCLFAVWCAWKIGNVTTPEWVHGDLAFPGTVTKPVEDAKKAERVRIPPERASTRRRNVDSPAPDPVPQLPEADNSNGSPAPPSRTGLARIACEYCRKKKQACRHLPGFKFEETVQQTLEKTRNYPNVTIDIAKLASASPVVASVERAPTHTPQRATSIAAPVTYPTVHQGSPEASTSTDLAQAALARMSSQPPETNGVPANTTTPGSAKKGRSKACDECRKSKRRCVHDVNGRVDPVKAAEPSKPRGSSSSKRPARISDEHQAKRSRGENENDQYAVFMPDHDIDAMIDPALMAPIDPMTGVTYDPTMPVTDVNAFSTPPQALSTENSFSIIGRTSQTVDSALDPALMDERALHPYSHTLESASMSNNNGETSAEPQESHASRLPQLGLITVGTPDVDTSFSPITAETSSAEIALRSGGEEDANTTTQPTPQSEEHTVRIEYTDGITQASVAVEDKPQLDQRRHSSNATGVSPKQEIMSASSRRSSSQTSGNTHVAASVEQSAALEGETRRHEGLDSIAAKQQLEPAIKQEVAESMEDTIQMRRGSTAASSISDVAADEEFARRLQMEEMGLRRRTSVRAP